VISTVIAVLRRAGKIAAGAVPTVLVARLGLPALTGLILLAVIVLGAVCWVIRSDARTDRVSRMLLAWRGNVGCIARDAAPAARPSRWPWSWRS
jgi:hypothetical protein